MSARGTLLVMPLLGMIGCQTPCDCALDDSGYSTAPQEPIFLLSPDVAQAGDVFITSLFTPDSNTFDYASIEELVFYGDVQVCTMQARSDELLVSLGVSDSAQTSEVDLVIVLNDGDTIYVESALTVLGGAGAGGEGTADGVMCAN